MNNDLGGRIVNALAFALGLGSVAWVAAGFIGTNPPALAMSGVIAAAFLAGAAEIARFRAATASLAGALGDTAQAPESLDDWLARLPPGLRPAVRLRIEGERVALPGLALTPYLVGLLVMLGMLGTFIGMVATFRGTVFALEGSADLQAVRTALAEPIRGLGLAFGTSVAGVAASAMLGLMSAVARQQRMRASRELDARIPAVFRAFSLSWQRQETWQALRTQGAALPQVASRLEALAEAVERRHRQLDETLLQRQQQFQRELGLGFATLVQNVEASLRGGLETTAQEAGASMRATLGEAMQALAARLEETAAGIAAGTTHHAGQLQAEIARLLAQSGELLRARTESEARWQQQLATREEAALQERAALAASTSALLQGAGQAIGEQRESIERLVRSATGVLDGVGRQFADTLAAQTTRAEAAAAQVAGSAIELASLGEAFHHGVQLFSATHEKLIASLEGLQSALSQSMARSDEQLAYYVTQAREVIDLSISAQQGILEDLRRLRATPLAEPLGELA